jgi:hypothetical protein
MYGAAVSWSSKKQAATAVSTMDAEYQACGAAARDRLSLIKVLEELSELCTDLALPEPVVLACDNKAALQVCQTRKEGQLVKHIDIIHHSARDHEASWDLLFEFVYCQGGDNFSDRPTKALTRTLFERRLYGLRILN